MSCARRRLSNTRSKSDPPKAQSFGGSALSCTPAAAPAFFRICAGSSPRLGGLAGLNNRVTTVNCYAFGSVTANSASNHFGGFIGQAVGIHVNTAAGNFIPALSAQESGRPCFPRRRAIPKYKYPLKTGTAWGGALISRGDFAIMGKNIFRTEAEGGLSMKIGNREFDVKNRTYIMGILNVTPDSFSDGGKWNTMDHALMHAEAMIKDGADILDVGGESTRPGHTPVSAEEEAARVVPVIEALRKRFDVPISVDTYKGSVADAAVQAGADLVNDVWGLKYDPDMAGVIAKHDVACCLMHNKANTEYNNFLIDMLAETQECVNIARGAGIKDERIILDPGVGFGKTYEMNLETMNHLELFQHLGFPVLLGTSRKSMIGLTLDLPVDQRVEGTVATSVIGVMKGCAFVRVHDIKENKRAILMTEAILGRNIK